MVSLRLLSLFLRNSELAKFSAQQRLQESLQYCVLLDANGEVCVCLFFFSQ